MRFVRHSSLMLVLMAVVAAPSALSAETRIAVVDIPRLVSESPQGKASLERLNNERNEKQREMVAQQRDLRVLEERLNRDGAIMSEAERTDVENRYRILRQRIERRGAEIDEDLNARRQDELGKIQRLVLNEVRIFAKEGKYDVVLGPGVVYADPETEITAAVLKRLEAIAAQQAAAKSVEPAKPAAPPKK